MPVHPLHARSEQGLLFLRRFAGDIAWIVTPPGQRMRDELDLCSLKKFRLAAPQNHLNPERSARIMLPLASCCDGSRGSATSSVEGVGFSWTGWASDSCFLALICGNFYPSENGDFNTCPERKSNKNFPLPGQMLQLYFCESRMG